MKRKIFVVLLLSLMFCGTALAKVNINTASKEEIVAAKLYRIGPATADKIIASRPFSTIEDITRVSGIGEVGSPTFDRIKDFITVGDDDSSSGNDSNNTATTTENDDDSNQVQNSGSSGASSHEDPVELSDFSGEVTFQLSAGRKRLVTVGSSVRFVAVTKGDSGQSNFDWSFGDGGQGRGKEVTHNYYAPGIYNVVVNGNSGGQSAVAKTAVEVVEPRVAIAEINLNSGLVKIANEADREINLGGWRLISGTKTFAIPTDTIISPKSTTIIPTAISGLPLSATTSVTLQNPLKQDITKFDNLVYFRGQLEQVAKRLAELKPRPVVARSVSMVQSSTTTGSLLATSTTIELPRKKSWWVQLANEMF